MNRLRFGIIGAGHLGKIHTRLIQANPEVDLIGVVDPIAETRANVVADFKVPTFANHADLLGRIDAAIIAAPTILHEQVASELMEAGIHVLVEKPITETIAQANRLIELAELHNVVLQVGHVEQFNPTWIAVKSQIHNPVFIEAHRCGKFTGRSTDISVVHDLMIHDLELVLSLVKSPVVFERAFGQSVLTSKEDYVSASLDFENGCQAKITSSRIHPGQKREMHVLTSDDQWLVDFANGSVEQSSLHPAFGMRNPQIDLCHTDEIEQIKQDTDSEFLTNRSLDVDSGNAIASEHADFIHCILNHQVPQVSGEAARDALALAERIVDQIRRGPDRLKTAA